MTEEVQEEISAEDRAALAEMGLDFDRIKGATKAISDLIATYGPENGVKPEEMTHVLTFIATNALFALEDHGMTLRTGKALLALGINQALEVGDLQSLAEAGVVNVPTPDGECPGCPECSDDVSIH